MSKYEMKREYVPIEERSTDQDVRNFDKNLEKRRREERERSKNAENIQECTFRPRMSKRAQAKNRSIEDLFQWQKDKRLRLNSKRMSNINGQEEFTFAPKITQKSSRMAKRANGSKDKRTEDRLLKYAEEKERRLEERRRSQNKGLFKPDFNDKSRKILDRKHSKDNEDTIKKVANGQVGNVKYFTATKVKRGENTDSSVDHRNKTQRESRRARTKSKGRFKGKIGTRSLESSKEKRPRKKTRSKKVGKKDPL